MRFFGQVCVRKSPAAARPGCCLGHRSKYSLLPASDTCIFRFPTHISSELRKWVPQPFLVGQHLATIKVVPAGNSIQVRHIAQLWEMTSAARPMQKAFLTALSTRCFLSIALSVQRSASEFNVRRKKFRNLQ